MCVLKSHEVCKRFGTGESVIEALRGIDLSIAAGEMVSIMGPSGSGKSTLLHILGGVETPTSGRVLLEGADLGSLDEVQRTLLRRRRLGFIFQSFNLLPPLSVERNVAMPLLLDGISAAETRQRVRQALERVGLEHRRQHLPGTLSGGEQQRAAIARALVIEPSVVLADEPTGNLDSANGRAVITLLRELVDQRRVAIVVVTHDAQVAGQTDRVIHLRDGLVEREASAAERLPVP